MGMMRVNITLPEDDLIRIDAYCKEKRMSRSALLQLAATQYLDAVEAMPSVNKMLAAMASVVDETFRGEMPPDVAKSRIDAIQNTYTALTGKPIIPEK